MKVAYLLWAILILGTLYIGNILMNIESEVGTKTEPAFNYIDFEMAEDRPFSKRLFASIHENDFAQQVQRSLDVDFWFIFFYVGSAVLGTILLLKQFKIESNWIFIIIAILGITAGVCDFIENKNLENLLANWDEAATNGAVEKAANFAKVKFAIIIPLVGFGLLGWIYFLGKKLMMKN